MCNLVEEEKRIVEDEMNTKLCCQETTISTLVEGLPVSTSKIMYNARKKCKLLMPNLTSGA
jgi:hypothetical protein